VHRKHFLDLCHKASKGLLTIDPHDKQRNTGALILARQWLKESEVVYILGYGFDDNNNSRIGLDDLAHKRRAVMFTNYNNTNKINKVASKIMMNNHDYFVSKAVAGSPGLNYYEKSERNVYDALELDFAALEA
jgi:hypothetical protein